MSNSLQTDIHSTCTSKWGDVSLVFALLPGKSEIIYSRFFTLLKDACTQRRLYLNPTTFFIDYETAVQNAASTSFPGVTIKGCFFHYTQCIWRKVQDTGLVTSYRDDEEVHRLVRRAAVLPLVPQADVTDVWFNAMEDMDNSNSLVNTTSFTDYVVTNWVETNRHLWNHYQTEGPRTINHLEGWHSSMKKTIQVPHPNIYRLLTHLKEEQAVNEVTHIQYSAGGLRPVKRRKYIQLNQRLQQLKLRLQNQEISVFQFADIASYLLHLD